MSTDETPNGLHAAPLYGALGVVVIALILVTGTVLSGKKPAQSSAAEPAIERSIRFEAEAGGSFRAIDADTQVAIRSYGLGEGTFIRTSIRSMTRNRMSHRVAGHLPYRLVATEDGKLSLIDPETGMVIGLSAFGQVASNSFAALLPVDETQEG
ncbi:MAG: photosynthetic complex assembly protein PuhC [Sphingomonadales bacterium]